jgi:hypothetical protein
LSKFFKEGSEKVAEGTEGQASKVLEYGFL